jgi:hypothetical protein
MWLPNQSKQVVGDKQALHSRTLSNVNECNSDFAPTDNVDALDFLFADQPDQICFVRRGRPVN